MRRFIRMIAVVLSIFCIPAFSGLAIAVDSAAPTSSTTRYVWANSLYLRAQPDDKSAQLAKIPYGTVLNLSNSDAPVAHTEVFAKYKTKDKTNAVMLKAAWQKVHWQDKEGWVFDGYLSRYPAPDASILEARRKSFKNYVSDEIVYADQIFGPGRKIEWDLNNDGVKSSAYQTAKKYMQSVSRDLNPPYTRNARWINIEWNAGANCNYYLLEDEGGDDALSLKNLPLTFNEALLWEMHFNEINDKYYATEYSDSYVSFNYVPGNSLSIEISYNSGFKVSIKCSEKFCDLASGSTS